MGELSLDSNPGLPNSTGHALKNFLNLLSKLFIIASWPNAYLSLHSFSDRSCPSILMIPTLWLGQTLDLDESIKRLRTLSWLSFNQLF